MKSFNVIIQRLEFIKVPVRAVSPKMAQKKVELMIENCRLPIDPESSDPTETVVDVLPGEK